MVVTINLAMIARDVLVYMLRVVAVILILFWSCQPTHETGVFGLTCVIIAMKKRYIMA